jgi:hypothetical protein
MAHRIAETLPVDPPLRVLHRGTAMVSNYRALVEAKTRRYHGLVFDSTVGGDFLDADGKPTGQKHGGFRKLADEVVTIPADDPYRAEYIKHLKDGDLWAADQATADAAGVPFEFDFGGEHEKYAKSAEPSKARAAEAARLSPKAGAGTRVPEIMPQSAASEGK